MPGGNAAPGEAPKSSMIATTGTTSKIIHPPEDISLEELRARRSKYSTKVGAARASSAIHSAQHQHQQQNQQSNASHAHMVQTSTASLVSAAHEQAQAHMVAQAAAVHQHQQQQQQKQIDDINRAVMFQRMHQASRPAGPPMGMVSI